MRMDGRCPLLVKPNLKTAVYQEITPQHAGWTSLWFNVRRLKKSETWLEETGSHEYAIVLLAGNFSLESNRGSWEVLNGRETVFKGLPHALYLPRNTNFRLSPISEVAEIACGHCFTDQDHPARIITPEEVEAYGIEYRGGDNATRQINSILPPGADCHRLVCVEVYTPSGNWSSYPPHKHDERRLDKDSNLLEAALEEIYFYKMDKPKGFGIQRVYTQDRSLDEVAVVENNDVMLIKKGYHPFVSGFGYNVYYLNFLVGSDQSLKASEDPDHQWIQGTWSGQDSRVPLVTARMNEFMKRKGS